MIVTTDAIVLRARRFRESSKILTLYTREFGRVSVVARGAMQQRSRLAHLLQPMIPITAVLYMREGRDLQNLSKAEALGRFTCLLEDLDRMAAGLAIVELVDATIHGQEPNLRLFDALLEALESIDSPQSDPDAVSLWFTVQLAEVLGYGLRTGICGVCEEEVEVTAGDVAYSLALGAPLCSEHRAGAPSWPVPLESYRLLEELGVISARDAGSRRPGPGVVAALNDALVSFVRHHVDGLRRLSVGGVMRDVLGTPGARA